MAATEIRPATDLAERERGGVPRVKETYNFED